MLGQLTERFQSGTVSIATIGCAAALLFSVLALAGPVGKAEAQTPLPPNPIPTPDDVDWYENDLIKTDGDFPGVLVTFKQAPTGGLMALCGTDPDCALTQIWNNCPHGWWPPSEFVSGVTCTAITDPDEADDIDGALDDVAGGNECLAVHLNSTESGPYNWTSRDIDEDECE